MDPEPSRRSSDRLVLLYGLLAVLTGIADILFYVKMERYTGFGPILSLISGILSVMAGVMLLVYPGAGSIAAAVLFPLWFLAHCISRLATQPRILKFLNPSSYYLTLVLNILGLILAVLMLFSILRQRFYPWIRSSAVIWYC